MVLSMLERLEDRACPSVFYDNTVIAATGQAGVMSIQPDASINDAGKVALVASVAAGQEVLVGNGTTTAVNITGGPLSSRTFGPEIQINSTDQVAAVVVQPGATSTQISRIYNADAPSTFTNIAVGTSPKNTSSNFDAVGSFSSISNDGNVAMAGFEFAANQWEVHQSNSLVDSRDIFNTFTRVTTLPAGTFFRQQSANGNLAVVSTTTGSGTSQVRNITLYHNLGVVSTTATIASTASGFWGVDPSDPTTPALGIRPGISDDGSAVVFYGNLTAAGAAASNLTPGPGIFASIESGVLLSTRRLVRLTGGANQNLGFTDSASPIGFASYQVDSQVSVILQQPSTASGIVGDTLVAGFLATPNAASRTNPQTGQPLLFTANNQALWTVRADFLRPLSDPFPVNVSSPLVVAQVGSPLVVSPTGVSPATVVTVAALAVSDALAQDPRAIGSSGTPTSMPGDHQIAFWVRATDGSQLIIRGTHLDTDQDGLLDHWERPGGGIDINQDGAVDLNMNALGASVNHRDLFVEMDWLKPVTGPLGGQPGLPTSDDAPSPVALQQLVSEFATAPLTNPDRSTGIRLHIDAGSLSVDFPTGTSPNGLNVREGGDLITESTGTGSHIDVVYFSALNNDPNYRVNGVVSRSFDSIKQKFFGTADLDARELGFHYVVLADYQDYVRSSGGPVRYGVSTSATITVPMPSGGTATYGALAVAGATFLQSWATDGDVIKITSGPMMGAELVIDHVYDTTNPGEKNPKTGNVLSFLPSTNLPASGTTFTILSGSSGLSELSFQDPTLNQFKQTAQPFNRDTLPGNDVLITLGQEFRTGAAIVDPATMTRDFARTQSQTLLHELGHNLGLQHEGIDSRKNHDIPNYPSVMSYDHQFGNQLPYSASNPNGYITDYSRGGSGVLYNDWANIRMDFQDNMAGLGNSFGLNGNGIPQTTDNPDDYVSPKELALDIDPNADVSSPFVAVDSPAPFDTVAVGNDLVVNFRAADDVALASVVVQFDVNGDGTLQLATPVSTGLGMYQATFFNVSGSAGQRSILVSAADTSNNVTTQDVEIDITSMRIPPQITTQPTSQKVNSGQTATFTAAASGVPTPTVQWQVSTDGGLTFNDIAGAISTSYSIAATAGSDGDQFRAIFTNDAGVATTQAAILGVQRASISLVSVSWGAAGTSTLLTASDGLRLLPAGRSTSLPWLGINRIEITLNQSALLVSRDIVATSASGIDYGPVVVSGSGSNYFVTLSRPIATADRVTLTIGNADIATFTRRLDVLPGDVNDDGVVTLQDAVIERNGFLGFAPVLIPLVFLDVLGDGSPNLNNYNMIRKLIGSRLP